MNGWSRGNEHIQVTHIPNRKKPVILIGNGYAFTKIGSFDGEEDAEAFCEMINRWLGLDGRGEKWEH